MNSMCLEYLYNITVITINIKTREISVTSSKNNERISSLGGYGLFNKNTCGFTLFYVLRLKFSYPYKHCNHHFTNKYKLSNKNINPNHKGSK